MVHVFSNLEEVDDGFPPMCDMTFEIIDKDYDDSASAWRLAFRADSTPYEPVGFYAVIPVSGWQEQVDGEDDDAFHSFWGSVTLHSRGVQSDRLLALMADYYDIAASQVMKPNLLNKIFSRTNDAMAKTWKFPSSVDCLAVGIASNPALIEDEPIRMKLFFDEGVENGRYAEVFFNVDLPEGFGALNEKDEEYRVDLIHWLSLPGNVAANPYAIRR